jgi:hypothetical protein
MGEVVRKAAVRIVLIASLAVAGDMAVQAQSPQGGPVTVEVDAIKCWWRTSSGAVRVGEQFSLVLTCAVVDNETTVVAPNQSELEAGVILLPPFDVVSGTHPADLRTPSRRFFQYNYVVRLIQDNMFGKDVTLPPLQIKFRVRTRVPDGTMIEGQEQTYVLPPTAIRVLSLVPQGALDIRDTTDLTFGDVESKTLRSRVLVTTGGVLFSLSGIMGILALVAAGGRFFRSEAKTRQLVNDSAVLRGAAKELADVRRSRETAGWSDGLAGRALAALRVVSAYAVGRQPSQRLAASSANGHDGELLLSKGLIGRQRAGISASTTTEGIKQAMSGLEPGSKRHQDLEKLQTALARFSAAQYGSNNREDATGLDESLGDGIALARRLAVDHLWLLRRFRTTKAATVERRGIHS